MKFLAEAPFEKHLKQSYPDHLSRLYLFISPCDYERRLWTEHLLSLLKNKDPTLQVIRFHAREVSPIVISEEVRAPSLWKGMRVLIVEEIDQVKPLDPFFNLLQNVPEDVVLIFEAAASKPISELYQRGKKELIVLDVSDEKPWHREKRLSDWMREQARKEGKNLPSDVALQLLHQLGTDLATLDQELKKLITYVGEKKVIDKDDIQAICGSMDLLTGWQLAEALVWKHPVSLHDKLSDLSFVFPFLGQIRYHLQLGARLADLLERDVAVVDLQHHLPSLRPQQLDKFAPIAAQRKSSFFLQGLIKLYEFELLAKSVPLDLGAAFDLFQGKIYSDRLKS